MALAFATQEAGDQAHHLPGNGGAGEACSAGPRSGWPAIPRIERRVTRQVRAVAAPGNQGARCARR